MHEVPSISRPFNAFYRVLCAPLNVNVRECESECVPRCESSLCELLNARAAHSAAATSTTASMPSTSRVECRLECVAHREWQRARRFLGLIWHLRNGTWRRSRSLPTRHSTQTPHQHPLLRNGRVWRQAARGRHSQRYMHSGGCDACSFSAEQKGGTCCLRVRSNGRVSSPNGFGTEPNPNPKNLQGSEPEPLPKMTRTLTSKWQREMIYFFVKMDILKLIVNQHR